MWRFDLGSCLRCGGGLVVGIGLIGRLGCLGFIVVDFNGYFVVCGIGF